MKSSDLLRPVSGNNIEAVSGADFSISCEVLPGYDFDADYLSVRVFLDGYWGGGIDIMKAQYNKLTGKTCSQDHVDVGGGPDRKRLAYKFASLDTRETIRAERIEDMKA